jgi:putative membrane protein
MNRRFLLASIAAVSVSRWLHKLPLRSRPRRRRSARPRPLRSAYRTERKHINDTMTVGSLSLMLSRIARPQANNALLKRLIEFEIAEPETVADILKAIQTNAPQVRLRLLVRRS